MARKLSDMLAGASQGAFQGASTGAMYGGKSPLGPVIGAVAGGLTGLVMGLASEEDPEEALNKKLVNEGLKLSIEEKKMVLAEARRQKMIRNKVGQGQATYMKNFFEGAKMATPAAPTASQRLYGVQ